MTTTYSNSFSGTLVTTGNSWGNITNSDSGSLTLNISVDSLNDVVGSGTLTNTSIYTVPEPPQYGNYVSSSSGSDTERVGGAVDYAPPSNQVVGIFYVNGLEASFGGNF